MSEDNEQQQPSEPTPMTDDLKAGEATVQATITIVRKATGKVETYNLTVPATALGG